MEPTKKKNPRQKQQYLSVAGIRYMLVPGASDSESFAADKIEIRFYPSHREEHLEHKPYIEIYNNLELAFTQILQKDAVTLEEKNTVLNNILKNLLEITTKHTLLLEDLNLIKYDYYPEY